LSDIRFELLYPCVSRHPENGKQCEQVADHEDEHWYTVWCEDCEGSYPDYPVFWGDE
jgi:hypothetical protein